MNTVLVCSFLFDKKQMIQNTVKNGTGELYCSYFYGKIYVGSDYGKERKIEYLHREKG